jgi:homoserine O-succinyltransferase
MPVLMDRGPFGSALRPAPGRFLELGLINNMPDAALESTERQFLELLRAASDDIPVRLRLFALPDVPRTDAGRQHLRSGYCSIDDLWSSRLDGLIVTGTEPRAPSLMDEPYWGSLIKVLEWAQENTISTVWSCLAAHAAVLHLDGIRRQALDEKRFGTFECEVASDHPLMAGVPPRVRIPHSRCNELPEQPLRSSGYTILTHSPEAGVDAFAKHGKSLFVFFQGHPEYDERALLREYRRDIARFLRRERETYPALPRGYFDDVAADVLAAFRNEALHDRREVLLESFPASFLEARLHPTGRTAVTRIYGNWLTYLCAQKARRQASPSASLRSRQGVATQPAQVS